MKILIVANFAPPQNHVAVPRIHSWARDWSRLGHDVTVLTTKKVPGLDGKLDGSALLEEYPKDKVSFIEIPYANDPQPPIENPRVKNYPQSKSDGWRRLLRRLAPFLLDRRAIWFTRVVSNLDQLVGIKKFDVVVSSFPVSYCHLIALIVSKKYGLPWLADYRDPWSCDRIRRAPWPFYLIDCFIEKFSLKHSARISAVSQGQAQLIGNFLKRKVDVIYNGSDDPYFASINEFRLTAESSISTIRYVGTIYDNKLHGYREFFEAVATLMRCEISLLQRLKFEFIGPRSETLDTLIESLGLQQFVETKGGVSMTEAQRLMRESTALLFFDIRDSFKMPGVLSGKIFDYLSARRPIISVGDNLDSDVNRMVKECGAGVFFDITESPRNLSEVLSRVLPQTSSLIPNYMRLEQFRRSVQSDRALSIIKEMISSDRPGANCQLRKIY